MAADVFISYRGADRVLARKLEYRLRSRWGGRVFRDERGLPAGQAWADGLTDAMKEARVMIALIGPGWEVSPDPGDTGTGSVECRPRLGGLLRFYRWAAA